jgi:hypothetical protein
LVLRVAYVRSVAQTENTLILISHTQQDANTQDKKTSADVIIVALLLRVAYVRNVA